MIKGSKVVVTGGSGFIGSWVVEYLIKEKAKAVVILDDFSRGSFANIQKALKNKSVKLVKGDIKDPKVVEKVIKGSDLVVHEAVIRITQCAENPRLCHEILTGGTFNVLEASVKYKVKKLVFNSSASVYGNPTYLPMDENHPFNNDTLYGAAKIATEQYAKAFRKMYGLNYVILRPFNVYGPRMDIFGVYTEVLIKWLDRIDQGLPPIIHGDGSQSLDFVYVEDVARATTAALNSNVNEGVFNVGFGKEVSLNQLLRTLLKLRNSKLQPEYQAKRETTHVNRRRADIRLAKRLLKFKATVTLEEGLRKLIEWRDEKKKNVTK